jgi:hypothetical protein
MCDVAAPQPAVGDTSPIQTALRPHIHLTPYVQRRAGGVHSWRAGTIGDAGAEGAELKALRRASGANQLQLCPVLGLCVVGRPVVQSGGEISLAVICRG